MFKISRIAIMGGTVALAGAAGLYMQSGAGPEPAADQIAMVRVPDTTLPQEAESPAALDARPVRLVSISLTSADLSGALPDDADLPETPVLAAASSDDLMDMPGAALSEPGMTDECALDLSGDSRAAAMVALRLTAPCQPNARVTLVHGRMSFTASTDAEGILEVEVPALEEEALFVARTGDGNAAALEMRVDSLAFYDRAVVQWHGGRTGVAVHAREFGAEYDTAGHVWAGAPREAAVAARGEGGFLVRLGDAEAAEASMADVYTFPTGTTTASGEVALTVEVEVTETNCDRDLMAEVIQVSGGREPQVSTLDVVLPACDAVGDYLLLKNLVDDLKIAAR
ncbi:translocase [Pseudooceanicola batsensis HTCC2597]|uniref:Translocase n=1 Tax=Pseudooceanicola batsensis (strain ATCC BAA-863 / DSM 15984 / KCTC 12145 / HTCC2597) TaxID=252305 RepID=A3TWK8_PSEBH|nr:hypothetical protein [Pseudooceanicola batsensis]EAQ04004.1 translocase [Pseudooceanicola batsensis HTCC2597]